jgi:hypothetical protein
MRFNLGCPAGRLEAQCLLYRDLVEGVIDILTLASSTTEPSDLTRILTLIATTRFTATSIFILVRLSSDSSKTIDVDFYLQRRLVR